VVLHDLLASLDIVLQIHGCDSTPAFAPGLEGEFPLGRFPRRRRVRDSGSSIQRAAGSGFAVFWCTGGLGGLRADVPKSATDPAGEPAL